MGSDTGVPESKMWRASLIGDKELWKKDAEGALAIARETQCSQMGSILHNNCWHVALPTNGCYALNSKDRSALCAVFRQFPAYLF